MSRRWSGEWLTRMLLLSTQLITLNYPERKTRGNPKFKRKQPDESDVQVNVHDELLFFTWFQWCNQGTNDQRLFDSSAENVLSSDFILTSTKDSSSWKLKKQKFAHTLAHVATVIRRVTYKNVIVEEFIAATTWPPIHNKADINVITYVKRNYLL